MPIDPSIIAAMRARAQGGKAPQAAGGLGAMLGGGMAAPAQPQWDGLGQPPVPELDPRLIALLQGRDLPPGSGSTPVRPPLPGGGIPPPMYAQVGPVIPTLGGDNAPPLQGGSLPGGMPPGRAKPVLAPQPPNAAEQMNGLPPGTIAGGGIGGMAGGLGGSAAPGGPPMGGGMGGLAGGLGGSTAPGRPGMPGGGMTGGTPPGTAVPIGGGMPPGRPGMPGGGMTGPGGPPPMPPMSGAPGEAQSPSAKPGGGGLPEEFLAKLPEDARAQAEQMAGVGGNQQLDPNSPLARYLMQQLGGGAGGRRAGGWWGGINAI